MAPTSIKETIIAFARTFKIEDAQVLGITAAVTFIGKMCAGIIPVFALAVVVYQLKIQITRLKVKRIALLLKEKEKEKVCQ
jgi:hypothetical protein